MTGGRRFAFGVGAAALAVAGGAGCTVGGGSGQAAGPLWVLGCNINTTPPANYGTPDAPLHFSLNPTFFAGDPIDSTSYPPKNRLIIRMQRNGTAGVYNDTFYIDILDSYQVARCLRGSTMGGVDNWDVGGMGLGEWCDQSGMDFNDGGVPAADGGVSTTGIARIKLSSQGYVQAALQPLGTCPLDPLSGKGAALVGHSVDGWIDFENFAGAPMPEKPPSERPILDKPDFKVNFGERLHARFHVVLQDDRVLTAQQTGAPGGPVPDPFIGGTLDGSFDFDFDRGRAAQPFP